MLKIGPLKIGPWISCVVIPLAAGCTSPDPIAEPAPPPPSEAPSQAEPVTLVSPVATSTPSESAPMIGNGPQPLDVEEAPPPSGFVETPDPDPMTPSTYRQPRESTTQAHLQRLPAQLRDLVGVLHPGFRDIRSCRGRFSSNRNEYAVGVVHADRRTATLYVMHTTPQPGFTLLSQIPLNKTDGSDYLEVYCQTPASVAATFKYRLPAGLTSNRTSVILTKAFTEPRLQVYVYDPKAAHYIRHGYLTPPR